MLLVTKCSFRKAVIEDHDQSDLGLQGLSQSENLLRLKPKFITSV